MVDVEDYKEEVEEKFEKKFQSRCKLLDSDLLEKARQTIEQTSASDKIDLEMKGDMLVVTPTEWLGKAKFKKVFDRLKDNFKTVDYISDDSNSHWEVKTPPSLGTSTSGTSTGGTGGKKKEYGQDIILIADNCKSCDTLINILSEPVLQNEIEVIKALSNRGQNIISQMPDDIALPLYVVHERDGYKMKELKDLVKKYG